MDLNSVNSLKEKGNDAFKLGNLKEALEHYTKAIEILEADGDKKTAAIILSNRAQLHLKMEKYQQALEDADKSLEYDPSFRKSSLRRAMANTELGNNSEAMKDLREILALEPGNSTVRSVLKRVSEPVKMDDQLREAYIGHYFRRWMTDRHRMALESVGVCEYAMIPVLRQSFLSVNSSMIMHKVLSGSIVVAGSAYTMFLKVSCWFVSKRMRVDVRPIVLFFPISYATLSTLYCVVQPVIDVSIGSGDGGLAQQFGSTHKCEKVSHCEDFHFHPPYIGPKDIQVVEKASRILTRLPYFADVVKFKDKTFPMVDTLIIAPTQIVDMKFLKLWKRQQWRIKNIVSFDGPPNLSNFERFEGIISNHVTHVRIPSSILSPGDPGAENEMKQFKNNMQTLKRVFPMLDSVTVDLCATYPLREFPDISHAVKCHIFYLTDNFVRRLKPDWCRKFKIITIFRGLFELGAQVVSISLQPLENLVKECRGEMKRLNYIRSRGPTALKTPRDTMTCFAAIEMATNDAEFQVVFFASSSRS